jgi:protein-L-isoaspartate(D-aspartate) O-methyltransferase
MSSIEAHRRFYARYIVHSAGSNDERLIAAFESIPREDYMGPGPWPIFAGSGYLPTVSDDPHLLYQDVLVGLATDRGINNGQPTLHARCLAAVSPAEGETAVHIGAGTGYYTAVLAQLVGASGRVIAYEIEPDLAARARANLAHASNVDVIAASAADTALPAADVIYVNAGATHPPAAWLDALNIGGRLIFPLTPNLGFGCMLLVTRRAERVFAAEALMRVAFIPCIGARDDDASESLTRALESHSLQRVKSLRRDDKPDDTAWCAGAGWWLSSAAPE